MNKMYFDQYLLTLSAAGKFLADAKLNDTKSLAKLYDLTSEPSFSLADQVAEFTGLNKAVADRLAYLLVLTKDTELEDKYDNSYLNYLRSSIDLTPVEDAILTCPKEFNPSKLWLQLMLAYNLDQIEALTVCKVRLGDEVCKELTQLVA